MYDYFNEKQNFRRTFTLVGENCTYKDLFFYIATLLNTKKPFICASKTLTSVGWRLDWLRATLTNSKRKLTKSTAASSHAIDQYDTQKIENAISIFFQKKETFLKTVI